MLAFKTRIPASFHLFEASHKNSFWYFEKLHRHISFTVLHVLKSEHWDKFPVYTTRQKSNGAGFFVSEGKECCTCTNQCFAKKNKKTTATSDQITSGSASSVCFFKLVLTSSRCLDNSLEVETLFYDVSCTAEYTYSFKFLNFWIRKR